MEEPHSNTNNNLKNDLNNNGYDFYAILGFSHIKKTERSKISINEIKEYFSKKIRKYHPDYTNDDLSEDMKKNYINMFKLIQLAGQTLNNKEKRAGYDLKIMSQLNGGNFSSRKEKFKEFINLQEKGKTDENIIKAKFEFEQNNKKEQLDSKNQNDLNRKLDDLIQQRDIDTFELCPTNIFKNNKSFNKDKFMTEFEKKNKKNTDIIPYDEIDSHLYNNETSNLNLENSFNTLYEENSNNSNNQINNLNINSEDGELESIDSDEIDTSKFKCDLPNKNLNNDYEKLCKQRYNEQLEYKSVENFKNYKSSIEDKFGASHGLNFMVGDNFGGIQESKSLKITDEDLNAYKLLLETDT
jgi:hypothetical protein